MGLSDRGGLGRVGSESLWLLAGALVDEAVFGSGWVGRGGVENDSRW